MTAPRSSLAIALAGLILLLSLIAHAQDQDHSGLRTFQAAAGDASDDLAIEMDVQPPGVSIDTPAYGSVLGSTSTTVVGTVTDSVSFLDPNQPGHAPNTVTWELIDGLGGAQMASGTVPVSGGHFVIPDLPLVIGNNVVVAHAADAAGWTNDVVSFFDVDPNAPAAALVGFQDGQAVLASREQLDLNFAAPTTIVSVNGVPDGRSFPAGLAAGVLDEPLEFGRNTFSLVLQSGAETSDFSFTLFRVESIGPIAILAPNDRALVNQTAIPVRVTAPLGTPFVTVNGVRATAGADLQTFTAGVPLREGTNVLTAIAYPFGQRATTQVVRDTTPPRLVQVEPADGQRLVDGTLTVQGIVSEPATVHLAGLLGGVDVQTSPLLAPVQPFFAFTPFYIHTFEIPFFQLAVGDNPISFTLTDRAGNTTEVPYTLVNVDGAVHILDLDENNEFNALEMALRVEAFEQVAFDALYVGGRQLASFRARNLNTGISSFAHVPLVPGTNEIRLVYHRYGSTKSESVSATAISTAKVDATLRGNATDAVTGLPLAGATVTIARATETLVLTTSAAGTWSVDVPPGPFHLVIRHPGFIPGSIDDQAGVGETLQLDYAALRWDHGILPASLTGTAATSDHLEGTVTSQSTGQPLADAQVRVTSSGASLTAQSGPDGGYAIDGIPLGPFSVAVSKPGFFPIEYAIDDTEAVDVRLSSALTPAPTTATLVATIHNGSTHALEPNARALLLGSSLHATSDANGQFVMRGVPLGPQTLRLEEAGFADQFVFFTANASRDGSPQLLDIDFPTQSGVGKPMVISTTTDGVVTDRSSGVPLAGATVSAGGHTAVTDANGHFSLTGLTEATAVDLVTSAANHETDTQKAVVVPSAVDPLVLRLRSSVVGFISGTVTDASTGRPVPGVTAHVIGSVELKTLSDNLGVYTIPAVPPGSYSVEITQPSYLSTTLTGIGVVSQQGTTANVALAHRPTAGALQGRVTRQSDGAAVPGAEITSDSGATTSSASDGSYFLTGVPAGMAQLSIRAAGFPDTTREVAVRADVAPGHPSTTGYDIVLDPTGVPPTETATEIDAATGGSATLLGGRLHIDVPPFSVSDDSILTLKLSDAPHATTGQPLNMAPDLRAPEVRAVGPELTIRLESPTPGAPAPKFLGPIVLTLRYPGAQAAAANIHEQALFPYWFDGSHYTMLRTIPYFYGVDDVDKQVVVALDFTSTEAGSPVEVAATARSSLVVDNDPNGGVTQAVRDFFVQLGSALDQLFSTQGAATFDDIKNRDLGGHEKPNANALPLLVVHGWSPGNLLFATDPNDTGNPLEDARYGTMLLDLLDLTHGVYRPIFISYNTRADVWASGGAIYGALHGALGDSGPIHGEPASDNPDAKPLFKFVDSLGYSMGGLAERAYQSKSGLVRGMITIASPQHGALQNLVAALSGMHVWDPVLRPFFALVSPGTADLLDYDDSAEPGSLLSLNPFLSELNSDPGSAPKHKMSLIAGADSVNFVNLLTDGEVTALINRLIAAKKLSEADRDNVEHILNVLSEGGLAVSFDELNDGLVPESSAHARTQSGERVPALSSLSEGDTITDHTELFNHFSMGKADSSVRISTIGDNEILPTLSDWTVTRVTTPPIFHRPTLTDSGAYTIGISADFNVPSGDITAVVAVVYGKDAGGHWHVLQGADPDSLQPDSGVSISGNSTDQGPVDLSVERSIPMVTDDPNTDIREVDVAIVNLPVKEDENGDAKVPADPTKLDFSIPFE